MINEDMASKREMEYNSNMTDEQLEKLIEEMIRNPEGEALYFGTKVSSIK